MRRGRIFLSTFLFFAAFFFFWEIYPFSSPVEECCNVFSSRLYTDYYTSLISFVKNHPSTSQLKKEGPSETRALIALLDVPFDDQNFFQRADHVTFVSQLRRAIQQNRTLPFLQDLVRWMYLKSDIDLSIQSLFKEEIPHSEESLTVLLPKLQQKFYADSRFCGVGNTTHLHDPFLCGNLPYPIFSSFPFSLIRMGKPLCVTSRFPLLSPSVSPEFLLFIQGQPRHLYVNLMKRHGAEGRSSKVLEDLEKEVSSFFVITLDKDSSFYWQRASLYPKKMEYKTFKESFLNSLLAKEGNFFWSSRLNLLTWKETLALLIDETYACYFKEGSLLNRRDRRDLIELTYLAILDNLVERWHPSSLNVTCHQGMDRGPSLMVLWILQKEGMETRKQELMIKLLAPPLLIRNRASHASRIHRFVSAAERIQRCPLLKNAF